MAGLFEQGKRWSADLCQCAEKFRIETNTPQIFVADSTVAVKL